MATEAANSATLASDVDLENCPRESRPKKFGIVLIFHAFQRTKLSIGICKYITCYVMLRRCSGSIPHNVFMKT